MARGYRRTHRPALPPPPPEGEYIIKQFRALVRRSRKDLRRALEDWRRARQRGDRPAMLRITARGKDLRKDFDLHRRGLRTLLEKYGREAEKTEDLKCSA